MMPRTLYHMHPVSVGFVHLYITKYAIHEYPARHLWCKVKEWIVIFHVYSFGNVSIRNNMQIRLKF